LERGLLPQPLMSTGAVKVHARSTAGFTDVDLDRVAADVADQLESAREYASAEITWSDLPVVRGEEVLAEIKKDAPLPDPGRGPDDLAG
jgi:hypothetical protein